MDDPQNEAAQRRLEDLANEGDQTRTSSPTELIPSLDDAIQTGEHPVLRSTDSFNTRLEQVRARQTSELPVLKKRRRFGWSCLIPWLGINMMTVVLIGVAFFLPPFDALNPLVDTLPDFELLTSEARRIEMAGVMIEVLPSDPGEDFGVAVQRVSVDDFVDGNVPSERWACPSVETVPPFTQPLSDVYSIATQGTPPTRVGLRLPAPSTDAPDLVDVYGWYQDAWHFVPQQFSIEGDELVTDLPALPSCLAVVQVAPSPQTLSASIALGDNPETDYAVDRVFEVGMRPALNGQLIGMLPSEIPAGSGTDYTLLPLISNVLRPGVVDTSSITRILSQTDTTAAHIEAIVLFANANEYAAVAIDYRAVPIELGNEFSIFVQQLSSELASFERELIVMVPPATFSERLGWSGGAYDWRTLGYFADEIVIHAPLNPETFIPGGEMAAMLRWAVGEVDRYKLHLGINALSVVTAPESSPVLVPVAEALAGIQSIDFATDGTTVTAALSGSLRPDIGLNTAAQTPFVNYWAGEDLLRTFWLTTPSAFSHRLRFQTMFNLGGMVISNLYTTDGLQPALADYRTGTPLEPVPPIIQWTVYDESEDIVLETEGSTILTYETDATGLRFEATLTGEINVLLATGEFRIESGGN